MAKVTMLEKPPPAGGTDPDEPLFKQLSKRMERADQDRSRHLARIADCYKYAMPWRHKFFNSNLSGQPEVDLDVIFDETLGVVLEDFAADMLNTFTPQKNNWLTEQPVESLNTGDKRLISKALADRQRIVFAEMARSNLYQALQEAYQDLGPGTMCILITDIGIDKPIHCECIPAPDLWLTRGPYNLVDGKFRKRNYFWEEVEVLWPDADMGKLGVTPQDKDKHELEVTDGCWRDWSVRGDETYQYVVESRGKIIDKKTWNGAGSCPFVTARWARDSTTAWGVGPTYRTLPATKTLQHLRFTDLKNYDKYVDPPTSYEDDGVINVDNGVNPGDWIARAPGSMKPEAIESQAKFDVAVFERDELRSVIKRAHYQDRPEQLGKTPPTAFQWADERAERARRMGTPATNLVEELQYGIYRRFLYLLNIRGVLPEVKLEERVIALEPISPLLRAQEQEEVIRLDRFAEMIGARFGPQIALIVIDLVKYAHRLAELLGVDAALLRDEAGIAAAIQQLLPVLQNFSAPGGGAIAPPPVGAISAPAQGAAI